MNSTVKDFRRNHDPRDWKTENVLFSLATLRTRVTGAWKHGNRWQWRFYRNPFSKAQMLCPSPVGLRHLIVVLPQNQSPILNLCSNPSIYLSSKMLLNYRFSLLFISSHIHCYSPVSANISNLHPSSVHSYSTRQSCNRNLYVVSVNTTQYGLRSLKFGFINWVDNVNWPP